MHTMTTRKSFGVTKNGQEVDLYTIKNGRIEMEVITYGAIIKTLKVPDRNGQLVDIVLGSDTLEDYENGTCYVGCMVGRVANRIKHGHFNLNDKSYQLATNDVKNHLHGGIHGFNTKIWTVVSSNGFELKLNYKSDDGEEGYPGLVDTHVTYSLCPLEGTENVLTIIVQATTTEPCPVNLTNHSYFNLSGESEPNVYDHEISALSEKYLPTDENYLTTGVVAPVVNTPYDLTSTVNLGSRIEQLCNLNKPAFDTFYCLSQTESKPTVTVYSPKTGVRMQVSSTQPGFQFYSAHFLNHTGKNGRQYGKHNGFCLEFQGYPDAVNNAHYPSVILTPGQRYYHETIFAFDVVDHH